MRFVGLGTVILLISLAGCAPYEACRSDLTHRFQAYQAWRQHAHDCDPDAYPKDFASGWKEGYLAVTSGSSGDVPPVPPEKYWKDRYRTPAGRGEVDAWYSGYQYGTMVAEQDGSGQRAHIPVALGMHRSAAPIWEPGEWPHPLPEQVPAEPFEELLQDNPPVTSVVEPPKTAAAPAVEPEKLPTKVAEVGPQPAPPLAPRVATRPVPSVAMIAEEYVWAERDREIDSDPKELPAMPAVPATPQRAARPVPSVAMIAEEYVWAKHDRAKDSAPKESLAQPAAPATPRVAAPPVPSVAVTAEEQIADEPARANDSSVEEPPPRPISPAIPRILLRFIVSERVIREMPVSVEPDRMLDSPEKAPLAEPMSSAVPLIAIRFVTNEVVAEEGPDRAKARCVEVPPRFELQSGPIPMTFRPTPTTLKVLTAAREDSPSRRKKTE